ncbi:MAG: phospholipase D-like domain-containing protein [Leptolyngbyaceae cyanobacterium bins.349]|nr:phospholipase D-like domain-containing protein [Leptolyngbyaceae cyanobacterium bins.349]
MQLLQSYSSSVDLTGLFTLALTVGLMGCTTPEPPQVIRPTPLPQDPLIQVYLNRGVAVSYTEPYRHYTRDGSNLEQVLIDAIAAARSTVDIAVQELRLPGIAQALVERHRAGVRVRVILENTYSKPYSQFTPAEVAQLPEREQNRYQEARRLFDLNQDGQISQDEAHQRDALVILDKAQVPRIDDTADGSAGSNLMHHKFLVVDGQTVVVTSANLTTSDVHGDFQSQHSRGNANNLLKLASPELAGLFTQEFNYMWGDGPAGKPDSRFGVKKPFRPAQSVRVGSTLVEVQFSPTSQAIAWDQSSNGLISKTLVSATRSIQMALFVFSDQPLVDRLDRVRLRGVEIKALIDPGFAYRSYSEALDMMGISLMDDCRLETSNRPWKPAIATVGVPRLTPGDLLHHKFGVVDQQTVVTGSHNWTAAANTGNDETVLVIHNPIVAAHYHREFERLYVNAILGAPPAIQKKASAQTQQCQTAQVRTLPSGTPSVPSIGEQVQGQVQPTVTLSRQRTGDRPQGTAKPVNESTLAQRINLNTATISELEQLPGVGPSLAKRIVAARQKKRFQSLADLDQVSGVGPKLLEKLKNHVEW